MEIKDLDIKALDDLQTAQRNLLWALEEQMEGEPAEDTPELRRERKQKQLALNQEKLRQVREEKKRAARRLDEEIGRYKEAISRLEAEIAAEDSPQQRAKPARKSPGRAPKTAAKAGATDSSRPPPG
jgi:hypothetical protein